MASSSRKRARVASDKDDDEPLEVAAGFETPIFGAPVLGQVTTLVLEGEGGPLPVSELCGVASDAAGGWYVTTQDSLLHVSHGRARSVAAFPTEGYFFGVAASPDGSALFVVCSRNNKIYRMETVSGAVTTLAGSGSSGSADGVGGAAEFSYPYSFTFSPDGSTCFVGDLLNHRVRRVEVATGTVTTFAGGASGKADGVGSRARFTRPSGVAISPDGSTLFVADQGNHKIRRIEVATGAVTTFAGSAAGVAGSADGVGGAARFNCPNSVAISPDGSTVFVTDYHNNKIRQVEVATGAVTTIAGSGDPGSADGVGGEAQFKRPRTLAISGDGSTLLVRTKDGFRQVCVAAPPPCFAPVVVPPSTFSADMANTWGDASLPQGPVTFIVGDDEQRLEHVTKAILCVRSEYFRTMFGSSMKERNAAEITVPDTDLVSFTALVRYPCACGKPRH